MSKFSPAREFNGKPFETLGKSGVPRPPGGLYNNCLTVVDDRSTINYAHTPMGELVRAANKTELQAPGRPDRGPGQPGSGAGVFRKAPPGFFQILIIGLARQACKAVHRFGIFKITTTPDNNHIRPAKQREENQLCQTWKFIRN